MIEYSELVSTRRQLIAHVQAKLQELLATGNALNNSEMAHIQVLQQQLLAYNETSIQMTTGFDQALEALNAEIIHLASPVEMSIEEQNETAGKLAREQAERKANLKEGYEHLNRA